MQSLEELTIAQLKTKFSQKTAKFKAIRQSLKGQESKVSQVVDFAFPGKFIFLTEATHSFNTQVVDPKTLSSKFKSDNVYTPQLEIVDFGAWIDNRYAALGVKELQAILKEADVKIFCNCPAFHWQGANYKLSQVNASIYPTSIADPHWRAQHGEGMLCKHWMGIAPYVETFYSYIFLAKLKDKIKRTGIPKAFRGPYYK